jgi:hypothetical protein
MYEHNNFAGHLASEIKNCGSTNDKPLIVILYQHDPDRIFVAQNMRHVKRIMKNWPSIYLQDA